jgi:hypothetical protein
MPFIKPYKMAPSPRDARVSLELITAIYHSAQTGEAVDLPIEQNYPTYHGWLPTDG